VEGWIVRNRISSEIAAVASLKLGNDPVVL